MNDGKQFRREDRYVVIKQGDIDAAVRAGRLTEDDRLNLFSLTESLRTQRFVTGKDDLKCVVVENGWPEYEAVWALLETRTRVAHDMPIDPAILKCWAEVRISLDHLVNRMKSDPAANSSKLCGDNHSLSVLEVFRPAGKRYQYCWGCHTLFDDNRIPVDPVKAAVISAVKEREKQCRHSSTRRTVDGGNECTGCGLRWAEGPLD